MLKVENVETAGWEPALRGMRNPLNSWDRADTVFTHLEPWALIGPNDESLMRRLIGQGSPDHCKFRRMLAVWCDVTAPLYWWKEADTYRVGTVMNSCSTMHTLISKPFTADMFSCEDWMFEDEPDLPEEGVFGQLISHLNTQRFFYLEAKDKGWTDRAKTVWRRIIQLLPESWNQRRTWMLNYEVMASIYRARRHHKLREWHDFIDAMVEALPYPWIFTGEGC